MITQVNFVSINVRDQQRALEFYRDKLGFSVETDTAMDPNDPAGARWIEVRPPGAQTQLVLYKEEDESKIGDSRCVLTCDDIQKTYEELTAKGVEFVKPPSQEFWGWFAEFKDGDGNWFGLGQAEE
jgi:predicted enzyme related to lactoylglutathione lyase